MKRKILVAGDVRGNFEPLLKKVESFDIVLCVGKTLAVNDQTSRILSGGVQFSKPVYFIDNGPLKHVLASRYPDGGEICRNLYYLGNIGMKNIQGFDIFYCSGDYEVNKTKRREEPGFELFDRLSIYDDVDIEKIAGKFKEDKEFTGVDFLLTCGWPTNYNNFVNGSAKEVNGNEAISRLAFLTRPRYHVCGNHDLFFERLPYINYDFKGQAIHTTRLIGVANFPEPEGKAVSKYMYAVATLPLRDMTRDQITDRPQTTTENPYFSLFLDSKRSQLYSGKLMEVNETEDQIFSGEGIVALTEKEIGDINKLTDIVSLHVRGFD